MSKTDQAFIEAYRQETRPTDAHNAMPTRSATVARSTRGPHVKFGGKDQSATSRVPLSQAMQAKTPTSSGHISRVASTTVARFPWPDEVTELAKQYGRLYQRALHFAARGAGIVGFAGVTPGVGCTTTTLSAARAIPSSNRPVAIIDANQQATSLAAALGVLQSPSLADALRKNSPPEEAMILAADDNVSLAIAATPGEPLFSGEALRAALLSLAEKYSVTLVDLGSDLETADGPEESDNFPLLRWLPLDAVILVSQAQIKDEAVTRARQILAREGQSVVGIVETETAIVEVA